eukprot:TRINITY_DN1238_c0_g2_i1.p1 TRINITY_DN1238_c0_g2~~TRINITY_DN1238_c0_g2_i1.p1  ORF type:complete len:418 (+),score=57.47 TRINITY_DN1238_c0_g2_i1:66-1256(+)
MAAWVPNEASSTCMQCTAQFSLFLRRHHCRRCGGLFCWKCCKVSNRTETRECEKCVCRLFLLSDDVILHAISFLDEVSMHCSMQTARRLTRCTPLPYPFADQSHVNKIFLPLGTNPAGQSLYKETPTGRTVALKKIGKTTVFSRKRWKRTVDEMEVMRSMQDPCLIEVHSIFQTHTELIAVTEEIHGVPIQEFMEGRDHGLDEGTARNMLKPLLELTHELKDRALIDINTLILMKNEKDEGCHVKATGLVEVRGAQVQSPVGSFSSYCSSSVGPVSPPAMPLHKEVRSHLRPPPIDIPGGLDTELNCYALSLQKAAVQRVANLAPPVSHFGDATLSDGSSETVTHHLGALYCHLVSLAPFDKQWAIFNNLSDKSKQLTSALLSDQMQPRFILDKMM